MKILKGKACQDKANELGGLYDEPKIYDIKPVVILRDMPTLISITGELFDNHTSANIFNTIIDIQFMLNNVNQSLYNNTNETDYHNITIIHHCGIYSKNATHILCVLDGINATIDQSKFSYNNLNINL